MGIFLNFITLTRNDVQKAHFLRGDIFFSCAVARARPFVVVSQNAAFVAEIMALDTTKSSLNGVKPKKRDFWDRKPRLFNAFGVLRDLCMFFRPKSNVFFSLTIFTQNTLKTPPSPTPTRSPETPNDAW